MALGQPEVDKGIWYAMKSSGRFWRAWERLENLGRSSETLGELGEPGNAMGELLGGGEGGDWPPLESTVYGGRVRIGYRKICRISYRQRPIPFRNDQYAQVATFGSLGDFVVFQKWLEETSPRKDLEYSSSPNSEKKFLNAKKYIKKAIKTDEKHRKTMKN